MSTRSKVERFIDALRNRILSGEFGNDGRLPSFRTLATEYNTTQETMNKTMQALQAEGLLVSMGSKGVFVKAPTVRLLGFVYNFFKYLQDQNLNPIDENIEEPAVIAPPAEVKQALNLSDNDLVIRRFKRQKNEQVVFRIQEIFYPKKVLSSKMVDEILNNVSYVPFRDIKSNTVPADSIFNDKVLSRLPSTYEQKLLKIVRTNPVIDIKRTAFSKDKKTALYYQHLILNANLFVLSYGFEGTLKQNELTP